MIHVSEEWSAVVAAVRGEPGTVLVLGDTDTGKSTFAAWLAGQLPEAWQVDADPGQPHLGVPGCLGAAPAGAAAPRRTWFVGANTPSGNLLPCLVGTVRLERDARDAGARHVVVNTDGWILEGPGMVLKAALIDALRPSWIVALQRGDELERLLAAYGPVARLLRLGVSPAARARTPAERALRRQACYRATFEGAEAVPFPVLEEVAPGTLVGLFDEHNDCVGVGIVASGGRMVAPPSLVPLVRRVAVGRLRLTTDFRDA